MAIAGDIQKICRCGVHGSAGLTVECVFQIQLVYDSMILIFIDLMSPPHKTLFWL